MVAPSCANIERMVFEVHGHGGILEARSYKDSHVPKEAP